jgi:hypothetical protein
MNYFEGRSILQDESWFVGLQAISWRSRFDPH